MATAPSATLHVVDLNGLMGLLRRRWLAFALCLIAGVAGALYNTNRTPDGYQATATVIVTLPSATDVATSLQGLQLSSQLLQSYAAVATSRASAERLKASLGLPETVGTVQSKIHVTPRPETLLLNVTADDGDPIRAVSLADAAAQILIDLVRQLESRKQEPTVAQVVDSAEGSAVQVNPRPKRDLAVGILAGLLVGAAGAVALEALDRSVKGPAQLSELSQAPLLGLVPKFRGDARSPSSTVDNAMSPQAEAYRALRTALRFVDVETPLRTILITSAGPGEGKTTTATHFAIALAQGGERVILVDADLRRGTLLDSLGLPSGAGVTTVVTGMAGLDEVLQQWRDLLTALGTGPLPPNPAEILGSQTMAALLEELGAIADIVVIDAPPVLPVTDAVALSTQVDGVVIVSRDGKTNRTSVAEARRRLEGVGANVVGCVLNGVRRRGDLYAEYSYLNPRPTAPSFGRRITDRLRP